MVPLSGFDNRDGFAINEARLVCEQVKRNALCGETYSDGVVLRQAEVTESALFDLLNTLCAYGGNQAARNAMAAYRDLVKVTLGQDAS